MTENNNVLPADFDGVFRFTNFTEEDFKAKWGGIEYTYPAMKTTPMIISNATPEEVQNIRKKFARELAEREFYKSAKLKALEAQTPIGSVGSIHNATTYSPTDLESYVAQCLAPLPMAAPIAQVVPRKEVKLKTDDEGKPVSKVLKSKLSGDSTEDSLISDGTVVA